MLAFSEFSRKPPTFEDAAAQCEEFLWSELYRPYPGVERIKEQAVIQLMKISSETLPLIANTDWDGLQNWLKAHEKKINKNLKDARRNSILMVWMKLFPLLRSDIRANMSTCIGVLLDAWPAQERIADFKGQTQLRSEAQPSETK